MTGEDNFSDDDEEEEGSCDGGPFAADKDMMDQLLARYGVGNEQMDQDQDQRLVVNQKVRIELEGYKNLPVLPAFQLRKNGRAKPTDPLQW
jgi:hypothetical protein